MDAGVLLQVLISGLATGAIIGLVGQGFSLIAGTIGVLHLSHGDVVVGAVFVCVIALFGRTPIVRALGIGTSTVFVLLALIVGAGLATLIAWLAILPHLSRDVSRRRGDVLGWVVGGLAAGLLIREGLALLLPAQAYAVPDPLHLDQFASGGVFTLPRGSVLPVRVPAVLLIGLACGIASDHGLTRSKFGRSVRAFADDPVGAALCGVSGRRVVVLVFVIAGMLAGLAGLLYAPDRGVSVDDGVLLGLAGIAAAVLGGLGSLRGALVGGLIVGTVQAFSVLTLGSATHDVAPLALLIVVLIARRPGAADAAVRYRAASSRA
jgi:branched-subunit amino acid ABC-type transport system permease component